MKTTTIFHNNSDSEKVHQIFYVGIFVGENICNYYIGRDKTEIETIINKEFDSNIAYFAHIETIHGIQAVEEKIKSLVGTHPIIKVFSLESDITIPEASIADMEPTPQKVVHVKKVYSYVIDGCGYLTTNEEEAKTDPDYTLATLEELEEFGDFQDIICEVQEGLYVYWERPALKCVVEYPWDAEMEYGYREYIMN